MKSEKHIGRDKTWFCYRDYKTKILHGLFNDYNSIIYKHIGYYYKDQRKGFWITEDVDSL